MTRKNSKTRKILKKSKYMKLSQKRFRKNIPKKQSGGNLPIIPIGLGIISLLTLIVVFCI